MHWQDKKEMWGKNNKKKLKNKRKNKKQNYSTLHQLLQTSDKKLSKINIVAY